MVRKPGGRSTDLQPEGRTIDLSDTIPGVSHSIDVEHPVETALKKLNYRGGMLKVRDVFDIAVVDSFFADLLMGNLSFVSRLKGEIVRRISGISDEFFRQEIGELDIEADWKAVAENSLSRVRAIVANIPETKPAS